jgi:cytochrome P450
VCTTPPPLFVVLSCFVTAEEYGNAYYGVLAKRQPALFIADQKANAYVLTTASKRFVKTPELTSILKLFVGEGLFVVNGETHRLHRKVAQPAFTVKAVEGMSSVL